jgi:DNA-binding NtrC family response regulator
LLRVTQENEIDRVGGATPIKIDIRLIATSNRDLEAEAATGTFREDLLFRLNVVNLHIAPLRERPGDIAPLYQHFIKKYAAANGLPERPLAPAARDALLRHVWRGNVRELENTMHRAVLLAEGDEIDLEALSLGAGGAASEAADAAQAAGGLVGRTVAEVERDLILGTLNHTLGNRTHAATILGISIRTLRNKLRQYAGEGVRVPLPGEALSAAV